MDVSFYKWFLEGDNQQLKEGVLREIWEETEAVADDSTGRELHALHRRITTGLPVSNKKSLYYRVLRIAAVFLLPLLGSFLMYMYMQNRYQDTHIEWAESFVAAGQQEKITLSDGTTVWLNSGSLLVYAEEFKGTERTIYLNGEAIFNVAKDPERPFVVKTNYMEIEALGTVFNVEAYSNSEYTIATLEEGSIRIRPEGKESLFLKPDQQVRYHHMTSTVTLESVDADRVLQWKHGYMNFQKASFDYIAQALERKFDVVINYETNKFAGRSFNLKVLPDEDIVQILEVLKEMMPGLHYKINDKVIYIH